MKLKTYRRLNLILFLIFWLVFVVAFMTKMVVIAFLGAIAYMLLISLLKTSVKGVIADERQLEVSNKAAKFSFQILMPILLLTTLGLMMASSEEFYYLQALATVLSYIVALGVAIYALTYWYLDGKTGGR